MNFTHRTTSIIMPRIFPLLSLVLLFAGQVCAVETVPTVYTEQMLFTDDPKDWLTIKRVLQPKYPKELLAAGVTGYVDATVKINQLGGVKEIGAITSTPSNELFEKAARESLQYWQFRNAIDSKCVPQVAEGHVRIWFEIKDGKEKISVASTSGTMAKASESGVNDNPKWKKILNRKQVWDSIRYPIEARKAGLQADVYAIMTVDAGAGTVHKIEISHTIPETNSTRRVFREAITDALDIAQFEADPAAVGKTYQICFPFSFRLTD